MSSSKSLFLLCLSCMIGIALQSGFNIGRSYYVIGFLFVGTITMFSYFIFKKPAVIVIGLSLIFLVIGIARFQITELNIKQDEVRKLNDSPEKIILTGQIISEPDVRDNVQRLKVKMNNSVVLITIGRYPAVNYLDIVKATGKLTTPHMIEDFNYKDYLLKDHIYSVMDFPKLEIVSQEHDFGIAAFLYEQILMVKGKLSKSIQANFSKVQGSIVEGMVLGTSNKMPEDLQNKLNSEGLTHIIAVSGSHIVILTSLIMSLLLILGFWRQQGLYLTVIFIWIYIIFVGLPPSGVRAGIMGTILLVSQILGRQNTSSRTIVLAAALMLLQNPLLLQYDVGFQLSFLASLGIIYGKPLFDIGLNRIGAIGNNISQAWFSSPAKDFIQNQARNLRDILSVTLAAQLFTLPIVLHYFKSVSLVALLTNLLVLPVVTFIMSFGFLAALLGAVSNFLGWIFYLPCWLLLTYFLKILDIFYQPWALVNFPNISLIWFVLYYIALFSTVFYLQQKTKDLTSFTFPSIEI